jgi:hypothetical protein
MKSLRIGLTILNWLIIIGIVALHRHYNVPASIGFFSIMAGMAILGLGMVIDDCKKQERNDKKQLYINAYHAAKERVQKEMAEFPRPTTPEKCEWAQVSHIHDTNLVTLLHKKACELQDKKED